MSLPYDQYDYDDPRYVQISQKCEICGGWWYDARKLKSWSKHPNVIVHEECDPEDSAEECSSGDDENLSEKYHQEK